MAEKPTKPPTKKPTLRFEDLNNAKKLRLALADMFAQVKGQKILDARRRRTAQLMLLGFGMTVLVTLLDLWGALRPIENWFYDQRIYYFQYNAPPPSESIVHLDIDDNVLQATDRRWPWPREYQSKVIKEINRAAPKVLFLDITYSEEDNDQADDERRRGGEAPTTRPGDAAIATAIGGSGSTLAPVTLNLGIEPPGGPQFRRIVTFLMSRDANAGGERKGSTLPATRESADGSHEQRLKLKPQDVARALGDVDKGGDPTPEFSAKFTAARDEAVHALILGITQRLPNATFAEVQTALLGEEAANHTGGISDVINKQYQNIVRSRAVERFSLPTTRAVTNLTVPNTVTAPILPISSAAALSGFVDYIPSYGGDSKVRYVPLFCNLNGRMFPHVSLAIACAYWDLPLSKIQVTPDAVIIPAPGRPAVRIPVRTLYRDNHLDAGLVADIPWFGGHRWEYMYDVPKHEKSKQHLSLAAVSNIIETDENIRTNIQAFAKDLADNIDGAMSGLANDLRNFRVDPDHTEEAMDYVNAMLEGNVKFQLGEWAKLKPYRPPPPGQPEPENPPADTRTRSMENAIGNGPALDRLSKRYGDEVSRLVAQRQELRAELRKALGAKIVLLGFTATGLVDLYPTPLHAVAPGVVAHGAMVNGMLTDHFWSRVPNTYNYTITLVLGVLTTVIVALENPVKATLGAIALIAGYILVNGLTLFDHYRVAVGVAGPLTGMTLAWTGVTLFRYIAEIRERNRIQKRFSSYVDPELVNYIAAHPDEDTFSGREREMTVVFTDLEGFTTLSEKLKSGAVPILNEYVEVMAPIIRDHHGFLDKFLGDGIMFEFNTVQPNPEHALDAVTAVLEMQKAMGPINESLRKRELPTLRMRVGVNTGLMIVGDAGAVKGREPASNFTVLGDPVNLAARLESANKAFGSLVLVTKDTMDQTGGRFAVRPMAKVRVKGKEEAVMTFEPLCLVTELDDEKRKLIKLTTEVFDAFVGGDFEGCMKACDRMDRELGESKFAKRYHTESATLLAEGAGPDFDGVVTLSEK